MRSVYGKVLVWCLGTLLLSFAAFIAITTYISGRTMESSGPLHRLSLYLLDECTQAWQEGGAPRLRAVMEHQERRLGMKNHLVDSRARDVLTGEDLSRFLASPMPRRGDPLVLTAVDGPYRLLLVIPPPDFRLSTYLPFYLLILLALAGLCWLLAVYIGSPLHQLGQVVKRFGAGDLDARATRLPRDEIGDLGRAFNEMAGRMQRLLTAERQLLQDVSHELRSPLVRLSFAAELMRAAADRDAAVDRINTEIEHLNTLVGGLLEVTRAEGESMERNFTMFDLQELVAETVSRCAIEARFKNCALQAHVAPRTVTVRGDAELLRRAIENILSNAIRHSPAGSAVEVAVSVDGPSAMASVRDSGPGVPDDMLRRIFSPFVRVDESRQPSTGGLGLGLSIAKRAVLLHHGQILAENVDPGLKVTISLPVIEELQRPLAG